MDGYELVKRIRGSIDGRRPPFLVALTGYGLPEDRERALAAGFDEHLTKPVDLNTLARLLAKASLGF
jgi:two-component system, sensor histidine kinase